MKSSTVVISPPQEPGETKKTGSVRVTTRAENKSFSASSLVARPDGYDDIETLFQAIDLYDELIIEETTGDSCLVVPGRPDLETEANLIMRAARWIEKKTGQSLPVKVELTKRIPVAAGLGGGKFRMRLRRSWASGPCSVWTSETTIFAKEPSHWAWTCRFFLRGGSVVGEGIGNAPLR